jgi:hypothetical protein
MSSLAVQPGGTAWRYSLAVQPGGTAGRGTAGQGTAGRGPVQQYRQDLNLIRAVYSPHQLV